MNKISSGKGIQRIITSEEVESILSKMMTNEGRASVISDLYLMQTKTGFPNPVHADVSPSLLQEAIDTFVSAGLEDKAGELLLHLGEEEKAKSLLDVAIEKMLERKDHMVEYIGEIAGRGSEVRLRFALKRREYFTAAKELNKLGDGALPSLAKIGYSKEGIYKRAILNNLDKVEELVSDSGLADFGLSACLKHGHWQKAVSLVRTYRKDKLQETEAYVNAESQRELEQEIEQRIRERESEMRSKGVDSHYVTSTRRFLDLLGQAKTVKREDLIGKVGAQLEGCLQDEERQGNYKGCSSIAREIGTPEQASAYELMETIMKTRIHAYIKFSREQKEAKGKLNTMFTSSAD